MQAPSSVFAWSGAPRLRKARICDGRHAAQPLKKDADRDGSRRREGRGGPEPLSLATTAEREQRPRETTTKVPGSLMAVAKDAVTVRAGQRRDRGGASESSWFRRSERPWRSWGP